MQEEYTLCPAATRLEFLLYKHNDVLKGIMHITGETLPEDVQKTVDKYSKRPHTTYHFSNRAKDALSSSVKTFERAYNFPASKKTQQYATFNLPNVKPNEFQGHFIEYSKPENLPIACENCRGIP